MRGGSLDNRLHKRLSHSFFLIYQTDFETTTRGERLGWEKRVTIAIQVAEALLFLHSPEEGERPAIHHRDVKSSNILLDEEDNARLSDVGLAKYEPDPLVVGKTTKK